MTLEVTKSTQFKINEIVIVTKSGKIDISPIFREINIYDSIFMPVMSGSISIRDSIGLSSKLLFDGSESILIDISKDLNSQILNFKKAFRIYKQKDRTNLNMNSEEYVLNFVSDEMIFSDQQRINQSYKKSFSEIVKNILIDYLNVSPNNLKGVYEETIGIRKFIIPNLRPLDAIQLCTKTSVDQSGSPNFLFYQNLSGFNFVSLTTLLTNPYILKVKFEPKNVQGKDAMNEISIAREMEVISQNDLIETTRSGVNAGKFIGFDPITRSIATKLISYRDHYNKMKHGNENPNVSKIDNRNNVSNFESFNSKKTLSIFSLPRQNSNYIKKYDPTSLTFEDNKEEYLFQRQAIIKNLMNRRIKFTMPGNFQLSAGYNVYATIPQIAIKETSEDNEDKTLSGKYLIVASRQIISYDRHETIIEVATTSTVNEFIPVSSQEQTQEILEY
jgi:hypothetical protein